jgi:hypothetical protein
MKPKAMGKAETASRNKNVSGAADSGESRDGGTRAVSFSVTLALFAICLVVPAIATIHYGPYRVHGAALLNNLEVTPGVVRTIDKSQICDSGSTKQFRHTTEAMKQKVYDLYGVDKHEPLPFAKGNFKAPLYEIDHVISLELGGADEVENLWPQPYYMNPGAHEKDVVENYLHKMVCSGKLDLQEAQRSIATDWYQVYLDAHLAPASKSGAERAGSPGELRAQWDCWQWTRNGPHAEPTILGLAMWKIGFTRLLGVHCEKGLASSEQ